MKTKIISISILALLLLGLFACFTANALPPDPLVILGVAAAIVAVL